jgi:lipoprotein NlpI
MSFSLSRAANILIYLGRPAEAVTYLDDLAEIAPDDPSPYFDRGRAGLYSGQLHSAIDDFVKARTLKPDNAYFVIWLHIARSRDHDNDREELAANAAKLDQAKWPWPIVSLALGSSNPQGVREAAQAGESARVRLERNCEADFYIGVYDLQRAKLELTQLGSPAR